MEIRVNVNLFEGETEIRFNNNSSAYKLKWLLVR